jgi:hypothetical protein
MNKPWKGKLYHDHKMHADRLGIGQGVYGGGPKIGPQMA